MYYYYSVRFRIITRGKVATSPLLKIDITNIDRVFEFSFLGISFNEQLDWKVTSTTFQIGVKRRLVF